MKPAFQQLTIDQTKESFLCYWVRSHKFGFHWHYHPEFEITYVVKGNGTRLVGDSSHDFENHDLVFVGSNLPHTWISHDDFGRDGLQMEVIVLQFSGQIIENRAKEIIELSSIGRLLEASGRGLNFPLEVRQEAGRMLKAMTNQQGLKRCISCKKTPPEEVGRAPVIW